MVEEGGFSTGASISSRSSTPAFSITGPNPFGEKSNTVSVVLQKEQLKSFFGLYHTEGKKLPELRIEIRDDESRDVVDKSEVVRDDVAGVRDYVDNYYSNSRKAKPSPNKDNDVAGVRDDVDHYYSNRHKAKSAQKKDNNILFNEKIDRMPSETKKGYTFSTASLDGFNPRYAASRTNNRDENRFSASASMSQIDTWSLPAKKTMHLNIGMKKNYERPASTPPLGIADDLLSKKLTETLQRDKKLKDNLSKRQKFPPLPHRSKKAATTEPNKACTESQKKTANISEETNNQGSSQPILDNSKKHSSAAAIDLTDIRVDDPQDKHRINDPNNSEHHDQHHSKREIEKDVKSTYTGAVTIATFPSTAYYTAEGTAYFTADEREQNDCLDDRETIFSGAEKTTCTGPNPVGDGGRGTLSPTLFSTSWLTSENSLDAMANIYTDAGSITTTNGLFSSTLEETGTDMATGTMRTDLDTIKVYEDPTFQNISFEENIKGDCKSQEIESTRGPITDEFSSLCYTYRNYDEEQNKQKRIVNDIKSIIDNDHMEINRQNTEELIEESPKTTPVFSWPFFWCWTPCWEIN